MVVSRNKFFTLVKYFGKRKYAQLFMQGKIYMNYLGYFWDVLNGYAEQHDIHEGIVLATNQFQCNGVSEVSGVLGEHLIGDPMFRAEGYQYCNVACFYRVDVETFPTLHRDFLLHWQEYANMKEFGEFVVIIKDAEELMRRVNVAVEREKFNYCAGDVNYYNDVEPDVQCMVLQTNLPFDLRNMPKGRKFDSFCKTYKFKSQNEWRISLYRGVKEEGKYILDVGDLHDITCLTDIRHMADEFNLLLSSKAIRPNWNYGYIGNVTRDKLRELFIALGDNQAKMHLIVKQDILTELPPPQRGDFLERFEKKVSDVIDDFASGTITEEEFNVEIIRLRNVFERSHMRRPE